MPEFVDQIERSITLTRIPKRIVSVVPSQTELLYDLGLQNEVVGITKFCVHPLQWFETKERIGGTKTLKIARIKALQPDLILANKEENVKEQIEELEKDFPVWVSDVNTVTNALEMIKQIGELTGKTDEALAIRNKIQSGFAQLQPAEPMRTAYLIWKDPYMTVGGDAFIHDMMDKAGFKNAFAEKQRYPIVTVDDLREADCRLILLSSEPYPFKQKHIDELQKELPAAKIVLVDGELFSWYGSRMMYAPAYFQRLQNQLNDLR